MANQHSKSKPIWPYPEVGKVAAHGRGQWCKQIEGKLHYLGRWDEPEVARRRLLALLHQKEIDRVQAVQAPVYVHGADVSVRLVVNHYLTEREKDVVAGNLTARQFKEYQVLGELMAQVLGRDTLIKMLAPSDFKRLRESLRGGPTRVGNLVVWCRGFFKFASEHYQIVPRYGREFSKPPKRDMRKARRENERDFYTPEELRKLLNVSSPAIRAMGYLALNFGFGQKDCSSLSKETAERIIREGLLEDERSKTGIMRAGIAWPETRKALREYRRPSVSQPELFFITAHGNEWVRDVVKRDVDGGIEDVYHKDAVLWEWEKAQKSAGIPKRGFYILRHMFNTTADEAGDEHAKKAIMGHVFDDMDEFYNHIHRYGMHRIKKVVDHVRRKLLRHRSEKKASRGLKS